MYVITWATARSRCRAGPAAASQGMSVVASHCARAARSVRRRELVGPEPVALVERPAVVRARRPRRPRRAGRARPSAAPSAAAAPTTRGARRVESAPSSSGSGSPRSGSGSAEDTRDVAAPEPDDGPAQRRRPLDRRRRCAVAGDPRPGGELERDGPRGSSRSRAPRPRARSRATARDSTSSPPPELERARLDAADAHPR